MTSVTIAPLEGGRRRDVGRIYAAGIATGRATFETEVPTFVRWEATHLAGHRYVALRGGVVEVGPRRRLAPLRGEWRDVLLLEGRSEVVA